MTTLNLSERLGPSPELARGCATLSAITGFLRLRKASSHYSARALEIVAKLEDPAAETWVFTLLGLSAIYEGQWEKSKAFNANVVSAALRIGDRRRWRDGVENAAVAELFRGNWKEALDGLTAMFEAAKHDRDRRYMVLACRARAWCNLQIGDRPALERDLLFIKEELVRGLTAEKLDTRLDLHAMAATLALARQDDVEAANEADAAMKATIEIGGKITNPSVHCSTFLAARVFANLWVISIRRGSPDPSVLKKLATACRALANQSWSLPIAAPSEAIARGYLLHFRGRNKSAIRSWRRAATLARGLEMGYEELLALHALGGHQGRILNARGLPFLIGEGSASAIQV